MSGPPSDRGVNTRALGELFERTQVMTLIYEERSGRDLIEGLCVVVAWSGVLQLMCGVVDVFAVH